MHTPSAICRKRLDLANVYADAVTFQARASLALSDAVNTASQTESDQARRDLLTIREYVKAAKHAYRHHLLEHGCALFRTVPLP